LSDEEDKLVADAKAKLSEAELKALKWAIYDKTLQKVNDWICEDLGRIDHLTRAENVVYCRVLWIIGHDNKLQPQVDEWEAEKILSMRKIGFSIGELSRIFRRSTSTIHAHIQSPITSSEEREITIEDLESKNNR
jgi:hypothetical protein